MRWLVAFTLFAGADSKDDLARELHDKGWIIYLMPGHTQKDFENPTYSRIVLNAIIYKP